MSHVFKTVLLPSTIILGFISLILATPAVAEVSAPFNITPTNSTAQAVLSETERYGCLNGYEDGTYQGDRPISRYEFAASLNACLNQLNQLIDNNTAQRATKDDLAATTRQLETLRSELERLQMRLDGLDTENQQQ
jgi:ABC-type phosphate transport system auxiliary subunit